MVRYLLRYLKISQIDRDILKYLIFIEISATIFGCICNFQRCLLTYFEISFVIFQDILLDLKLSQFNLDILRYL